MSGVMFMGGPRFAATGGGFGCEGSLSQVRDLGSNPCAGMDEGPAVASLILLILVMLVLSIFNDRRVGSILDSRQMEFLQYL